MSFINGVIFGSAAALGVVLGVILLLRYVLSLDSDLNQTVIQSDLPLGELARTMLVFLALAVLAGLTFWGQVSVQRWRWVAEYVLAVALAALVLWFLAPTGRRGTDLAILAVAAAVGAIVWLAGRYSGLWRRIGTWLEAGDG